MNTPTLEEAKEYFKDAKEVESVFGNKFILGEIYISDSFGILGRVKGKTNVSHTIYVPTQGYAKILSYKDPKEKPYKITREQILKYNMKDEFPEVFETKLTVGKWYKDKYDRLFCPTELINSKECKAYGFGAGGNEYLYLKTPFNWEINGSEREATEQEVTEALTKETRKRYKVGDYVEKIHHFSNEYIRGANAFIVIDSDYKVWYGGCIVFKDGVFASVIPTITIPEAEAKLNCKIV